MNDLIARLKTTGRETSYEVSRPGSVKVEVQANSFDTFTTTKLNGDGSGSVTIERIIGGERRLLGMMIFTAESEPGNDTVLFSSKEPFGEVARA